MAESPEGRLRRMLAPRSVALVGASSSVTRIGGGMAAAFERWGYRGTVAMVGRSAPKDCAADGWFSSIGEAAEGGVGIDLAVLSVGTAHVVGALAECVEADVGGVVVLANAGGGDQLEELSDRVRSVVAGSGVRVVGPSSAGLLDPTIGLPASLMRRVTFEEPLQGPGVAILANSGAFANELLWGLRRQGVGISFWLTLGAEADVNMGDVMLALSARHDLSAVITLTESMSHGARYLQGARALTEAGTPVLAYQLLTSEEARAVASLHAGTARAPGELWRAAAAAAGIISCESMDDLGWGAVWLDASWRHEPDLTQRQRVAVVTISGGGGVVAVDRGAQRGVELTESFELHTVDGLAAHDVPTTNPVDIGATTHRPSLQLLHEVTDLVAADLNVDAIWLQAPSALYDNEERAALLELLDATATRRGVPTMVSAIVGWPDDYVMPIGAIVSIPSIDSALWAMAIRGAVARALERSNMHARSPLVAARPGLDVFDTLSAGLHLIGDWSGFTVPRWWVVAPGQRVDPIAAAARFPLVVKADSLTHKSAAGQVRLGISTALELEQAVADVRAAGASAVLVQEQVRAGIEVLLGCIQAADLGEVCVLGRGGVKTDEIADRVVVALPARERSLASAVESFVAADPEMFERKTEIAAVLTELAARFAGRAAGVCGVEMNPLIVTDDGCFAVDVRVAR